MLGRRHEPPLGPGEPGNSRTKIAGGQDDYSPGIELACAEREGFPRIGQVLDDINKDNGVHCAQPVKRGLIGDALDHIQAGAAAMFSRLSRELDAGNLEMGLRLLQKKSVSASYFEQPSPSAMTA